jgi:hypothetical protein
MVMDALLAGGKMMKTIFALLVLFVSTAASAACYQIYTPANELVWRRTTPPVPMDTAALNDAVRKKVAGGHLIISGDHTEPCTALDLTKPRKTMRQKAAEMKYD